MKRFVFVIAVVAALVPATALAVTNPSTTRAQLDCTKLRTTMGTAAFNQAYPTFGACVSAHTPAENQVQASAQSTCAALQADPNFAANHGGKTFDQYYGTAPSYKNALGRCISGIATVNSNTEAANRVNTVQSCRSLRTTLGTALFNKTYGKNASDTNAFGKCVSVTTHAQVHNEVAASSSCKTQQDDANFAANHGGKTFAQFYGTNADLSNAFGKCVSAAARAASHAQGKAVVNAARTCNAEQKANPAAFKTTYATFGACVAQKAKA